MSGRGRAGAGAGAGGGGAGSGVANNTGCIGITTRAVGFTLKLSQLQNVCKRDPIGYQEEYAAQLRRLESELGILALSPASSNENKDLDELIQFAAAVSSSSYKGAESDRVANMLMGVLVGSSPSSSSSNNEEEHQRQQQSSHVAAITILPSSALLLSRSVRKSLVSALILMRNKGAVAPLRLLELFFRILSVVPDKALREMLHRHIVNDIRNINKKGKRDDKVNRAVQSFFHRVISTHGTTSSSSSDNNASSASSSEETATDVAAKRATDMVCELYRRRVWTDDRTVAILASAATSKNTTIMSRALRFFLGIEDVMARDEQQKVDEQLDCAKQRIDYHSHSRKTAARQRHTARQLKNRKKAQLKKEHADNWMDEQGVGSNPQIDDKGVEASKKLYPAIELLRDPQGLAEAILKRLTSGGSYKYEAKLLMMNFVTRLVGNHELLVLPLYSFLTKYLSGQQRDVTAVLCYTVQACHPTVPPDEIYTLLKTIAHNFITERCSEEQMAVGINAARAICARCPAIMNNDESSWNNITSNNDGIASSPSSAVASVVVMDMEAFARDLAAYSNHRDRSVSIAGKGWTNFVRDVHPGLLQGKNRGLKGSAGYKAGLKPLRYGEQQTAVGVEGADLLAEYESKKAAARLRRRSKEEEEESGGATKGEEEEEEDDDDEDIDADDDDLEEDADDDGDGGGGGVSDDDDVAPDLVLLEGNNNDKKKAAPGDDDDDDEDDVSPEIGAALDLSKMSPAEREKLKQQVSSTRVFTASDFAKMRKLVERERRLKSDPREAARRKRAIAKGEEKEFEELSEDESTDSDNDDDDDDEQIRIAGAVNPGDIMALAKKKRQNKAEKLKKVIAGRTKFEAKRREGGSTNVEKKRTKNFQMSKFSREARAKGSKKGSLGKRKQNSQMSHDAKKRRRKL